MTSMIKSINNVLSSVHTAFANSLLDEQTNTYNGAKSFYTTQKTLVNDYDTYNNDLAVLLDLFFKFARGMIIDNNLYDKLKKAFDINPTLTAKLIINCRDIRYGKGERKLGRDLLVYLSKISPDRFVRDCNLSVLSNLGRWDDFIYIISKNNDVSNDLYLFMAKQLIKDFYNMNDNINNKENKNNKLPVSLLAKWLKRENAPIIKNNNVYNNLFSVFKKLNFHSFFKIKLNKSGYFAIFRKDILSPLKKYLDLPEIKMCSNEWYNINYEYVPSQCMQKHKNAFIKNDNIRFVDYINKLKKGEVKVNAGAIHPHEIVKKYIYSNNYYTNDVDQAQWDEILIKLRNKACLYKTLVVSDVSSSMYSNNYNPISSSIALGIMTSMCVKPPWNGHVITFSSEPSFHILKNENLHSQISSLSKSDWGGSTDLYKTMKLIVDTSIKNKLTQHHLPKNLLIISDMQFNDACNGFNNLESAKKLFINNGFEMPRIIFWNVNGNINDFPAKYDEYNVALISGFSPNILNSVMNGNFDHFTPLSIMLNTLNEPQYNDIDFNQ